MVVHHVEVDNIRAGGNDIDDFFAELGEIGGKNARCNFVHGDAFNKFKFEARILPETFPMNKCNSRQLTAFPK
ncbi:hypothetical protein W01_13240 [Candidatus Nitrotoga sp. AM1P]|nr:hypothetical protein W01_13240 [Candidatus Nitrotoga sp. AM1P]